MNMKRIAARFARCAGENRPALITFVTAGDPDVKTSQAIIDGLPQVGADLIELGMAFSDPMADSPAIQMAGHRALRAGHTTRTTLEMVKNFREKDHETPIILMGYFNPIFSYGVNDFIKDALAAGVDGLIIVDLPPEEDGELCLPAIKAGLNFIRLTTPTTDDKRLPVVLNNASGFIYHVSMTGITGADLTNYQAVDEAVKRIKSHTRLPVAVGFGIKTAADAALIGRHADGVVVGTALINALAKTLTNDRAGKNSVASVHDLVASIATGAARARK